MQRDRTDTTGSFKMDPNDLERVTHQDEVYTVVSKQFKQNHREGDKVKQKSANNLSQDFVKPRPNLRPSKSTDMIDGSGPPQGKPVRPAIPPHRNRGNYQGAGTYGGGHSAAAGSQYAQVIAGIPSHLPPPQIIRKQQSTDLPLVTQAPAVAPRPPSAPLLDTKCDLDYEEIDEGESPPIPEGNSPRLSPIPPSKGASQHVVSKQLQQMKKPSLEHGYPEVAKKPAPLRPKPVPAAKPPVDALRENKKQELHMKYKRIQDEMIRKQEVNDPQNPRGRGRGVGNSKLAPKAIEQHEVTQRDKPPSIQKVKHRPSYAEVDPEQEITVEEFEGEGEEAALWGLVRYPGMKKHDSKSPSGATAMANGANVAAAVAALSNQHHYLKQQEPQQRSEDSLKRSSSSSDIMTSDFYSNLTDLELNPEDQLSESKADSLSKKSHSFSEGLDKIVISATNGSR